MGLSENFKEKKLQQKRVPLSQKNNQYGWCPYLYYEHTVYKENYKQIELFFKRNNYSLKEEQQLLENKKNIEAVCSKLSRVLWNEVISIEGLISSIPTKNSSEDIGIYRKRALPFISSISSYLSDYIIIFFLDSYFFGGDIWKNFYKELKDYCELLLS